MRIEDQVNELMEVFFEAYKFMGLTSIRNYRDRLASGNVYDGKIVYAVAESFERILGNKSSAERVIGEVGENDRKEIRGEYNRRNGAS
jgi:hypothetical protein